MSHVLDPSPPRPAAPFSILPALLPQDIVWLDDPASRDPSVTGETVAHLAQLAARYPVPPGFIVTAQAWAAHRGSAGPTRLPERLRREIASAYRELATIAGTPDPAVTVHAVTVDAQAHQAPGDGPRATLAGVSGAAAVVAAVGGCWISARDSDIPSRRRRQSAVADEPAIAVFVQLLVRADVSIVASSGRMVNACQNATVVIATWGRGESSDRRAAIADTWVVDAHSGTIRERRIGNKRRTPDLSPGGSTEVSAPRFMRGRASLSDEQARQIAGLCTLLEIESGRPVDIEVAFVDGWLYLLRCRPLTTHPLDP